VSSAAPRASRNALKKMTAKSILIVNYIFSSVSNLIVRMSNITTPNPLSRTSSPASLPNAFCSLRKALTVAERIETNRRIELPLNARISDHPIIRVGRQRFILEEVFHAKRKRRSCSLSLRPQLNANVYSV
jgi:hypothetical protein